MQAGKLRHRIKIQQQGTAQDSYGAPTDGWKDVLNCWASIEPLRGKEYFTANAENSSVDYRITIRYNSTAIKPKMRILYGTRIFDIVDALNITERDREIQLMCYERVS